MGTFWHSYLPNPSLYTKIKEPKSEPASIRDKFISHNDTDCLGVLLPGGLELRLPGRGREKLKARWWVCVGEGEGAEPSRLTLWALRRHSTDRRSLHCLWQFTPQAGGGKKRSPTRAVGQKTLPSSLCFSRGSLLLRNHPIKLRGSSQVAPFMLI